VKLLISSRDRILSADEQSGAVEVCQRFAHPQANNIKCLGANPDRSRILAGFYPGGVFHSRDRGEHWTDVSGDLPVLNIVSCAVDPSNPDRFYVGTNPAAMFVTEDAGKHWRELEGVRQLPNASIWSNPRGPAHVRGIAVSPADSRLIYAAVEVGDIIRSEDGGKSWRVLEGVCHDQHKVLLSPSDPNLVFLSTGADSPPYDGSHGYGLFRSRDAGDSWENLNDRLAMPKSVYCEDAIASLPLERETVFIAIGDETPPHWRGPRNSDFEFFSTPSAERRPKGADFTIHRSSDGGQTWDNLCGRGGLPANFFHAVWGLDAAGTPDSSAVCFGTTEGHVWTSADGGASWRKLAHQLPPVHHLMIV